MLAKQNKPICHHLVTNQSVTIMLQLTFRYEERKDLQ